MGVIYMCCGEREKETKGFEVDTRVVKTAEPPIEGDHGGVLVPRLKPNGKPNKDFYTF